MRLPRVRFTVRRMAIAVALLAFLLWPIAEHIRWRAAERSDAAERAEYHGRMEKTFLDEAARSEKQAAAYRERAETARDPDERASWSQRASELKSEGARTREMARA